MITKCQPLTPTLLPLGGDTQLSDTCLPFMFLSDDSFRAPSSRSTRREAKRSPMRDALAEKQIDQTVRRIHWSEAVSLTANLICCSRRLRWTDAQLDVRCEPPGVIN